MKKSKAHLLVLAGLALIAQSHGKRRPGDTERTLMNMKSKRHILVVAALAMMSLAPRRLLL